MPGSARASWRSHGRRPTAAAFVLALAAAGWAAGQGPSPARQAAPPAGTILASIDARTDAYAVVAKQIWDHPELGFQEETSSALLQSTLTAAGFTVTPGVAGMPTAFTGTYGSGAPVVAIIGEFDALPGLSQSAGEAARQPLTAGAPGHGCGHNLLGTASAAAAIAAKEWLARAGRPGTVRYYGTPAEEGGGGKVYIVLAGLFADVDAVLTISSSGGSSTISDLFTVADVSMMRLFVSMPEAFGSFLQPGLTADVTVPQLPQRHFTAKFPAVARGFDVSTRTAITEFTIENEDRALWPGSYATVHLTAPVEKSVLTIPSTALVFQEHGAQVLS